VLSWTGREWLDVRHWGYDLRAPGRYTIRAMPRVAGPELEADNRTVRSNAVTVTIAP
jgi:hypothetical protein